VRTVPDDLRVVQEFATRHAARLKVVKVDVDANPDLDVRFGA
jgi:hypothetical protein